MPVVDHNCKTDTSVHFGISNHTYFSTSNNCTINLENVTGDYLLYEQQIRLTASHYCNSCEILLFDDQISLLPATSHIATLLGYQVSSEQVTLCSLCCKSLMRGKNCLIIVYYMSIGTPAIAKKLQNSHITKQNFCQNSILPTFTRLSQLQLLSNVCLFKDYSCLIFFPWGQDPGGGTQLFFFLGKGVWLWFPKPGLVNEKLTL